MKSAQVNTWAEKVVSVIRRQAIIEVKPVLKCSLLWAW